MCIPAADGRVLGSVQLPSEGRFVRLTLSAKGIKTVDKIGIEKAVARHAERRAELKPGVH